MLSSEVNFAADTIVATFVTLPPSNARTNPPTNYYARITQLLLSITSFVLLLVQLHKLSAFDHDIIHSFATSVAELVIQGHHNVSLESIKAQAVFGCIALTMCSIGFVIGMHCLPVGHMFVVAIDLLAASLVLIVFALSLSVWAKEDCAAIKTAYTTEVEQLFVLTSDPETRIRFPALGTRLEGFFSTTCVYEKVLSALLCTLMCCYMLTATYGLYNRKSIGSLKIPWVKSKQAPAAIP